MTAPTSSPRGPTVDAPPDFAPFDVHDAPLQGTQLLEASAGTGKTWTLTALHLRLLLEAGVPIARILVVTFTEAAVAELRTRVRETLRQARNVLNGEAEGADAAVTRIVEEAIARTGLDAAALLPRVQHALAGFDDAPISTIHAFCQRILRDTAFAAKLPLDAEVITDDLELRLAAMRDVWRHEVATPQLPARVAAQLVLEHASPQGWEPLLRDALAFPLARQVWADDADGRTDAAGGAFDDARHARLDATRQRAFEQARASWQRENAAALQALKQNSASPSYTPELVDDSHRAWQRCFAAAQPQPLPVLDLARRFARNWLSQQQERSKTLAKVPALPLFDDLQALLDAQATVDAALRAEVERLKRHAMARAARVLEGAKLAQGVMSFQDMLVRTHDRLHADAALAAAVRQRFPAALVDEFQDTDPVQLGIVERLYGDSGACVFLVGDPKQAIYGFRGGDVETSPPRSVAVVLARQ